MCSTIQDRSATRAWSGMNGHPGSSTHPIYGWLGYRKIRIAPIAFSLCEVRRPHIRAFSLTHNGT